VDGHIRWSDWGSGKQLWHAVAVRVLSQPVSIGSAERDVGRRTPTSTVRNAAVTGLGLTSSTPKARRTSRLWHQGRMQPSSRRSNRRRGSRLRLKRRLIRSEPKPPTSDLRPPTSESKLVRCRPGGPGGPLRVQQAEAHWQAVPLGWSGPASCQWRASGPGVLCRRPRCRGPATGCQRPGPGARMVPHRHVRRGSRT
jgi:hypothetical protein